MGVGALHTFDRRPFNTDPSKELEKSAKCSQSRGEIAVGKRDLVNLCQGATESGILVRLWLTAGQVSDLGAPRKALLEGDNVINNEGECHFNWRNGTTQLTAGGVHWSKYLFIFNLH